MDLYARRANEMFLKEVPRYTTRTMRKRVNSFMGILRDQGPKKAVLAELMSAVAGTKSSRDGNKESVEFQERVAKALLCQDDVELVMDLRSSNGRPNNRDFDLFWTELGIYLEDELAAADERRHGTTSIVSGLVGVDSLISEVTERLQRKNPGREVAIPSSRWVRVPLATAMSTTLRKRWQLSI